MTADDVRQALERLHDPLQLSQADICAYLPEAMAERHSRARAETVYCVLVDAIEALQPFVLTHSLAPAQRGYELLALHFVQRLPLAEAAEELHVSPRQAYRDVSQALEKLAAHLTEASSPETGRADVAGIMNELERLVLQRQQIDVRGELENALEMVQPLADRKGLTLSLNASPAAAPALGDASLLRQLFVSLLSWALRHSVGAEVTLRLRLERHDVSLSVTLPGVSREQPKLAPEIVQLCQVQNVSAAFSAENDRCEVRLSIPSGAKSRILVIEDNPGVVELYRRILGDANNYEVVAAPSPQEAVAAAEAGEPDVVILDILLPGTDGWTLLRDLRRNAKTRAVPVLVCSIYDEPELATSLGATGHLKKPITSRKLILALQQCLGTRPGQAL